MKLPGDTRIGPKARGALLAVAALCPVTLAARPSGGSPRPESPIEAVEPAGAHASSEGARRLSVAVVDPGDATLVTRIRGQTGDLEHSLSVVPPPAGGMSEEAATELARAEAAAVVVWFEREARGFVIHVRDVARGDSLTRRLSFAAESEPANESALAEAAALIVRSALVTLGSGETLGPAPAPAGPQTARRNEGATLRAAPEGARRPSTESGSGASAPLQAALGYELGADGAGSLFHGPRASGAIELGRLALGVGGSIGLARDLDDGTTRVTLLRHAADAMVGLVLDEEPRIEIRAELRAGLAVYEHRAVATRPDVTPAAPGEVIVPRGGLGLLASWFPGGGLLGVSARAGLDALPGPVRLSYEQAGIRSERTRLEPFQPVAQLGLILRTAEIRREPPAEVDPSAQAAATSARRAE